MTQQPRRQPAQSPPPTPLPAANLEAEQSVLGAALLDAEAMRATAFQLAREDFYSSKHGDIWETLVDMYTHREPIDAVTAVQKLTERGVLDAVGGPVYIAQLINMVPATSNVLAYADIVKGLAAKRRMAATIRALASLAEDSTVAPDDFAARVCEALAQAVGERQRTQGGLQPIHDLMEWVDARHQRRLHNVDPNDGLMAWTGHASIDRVAPLMGGELTVIAARPSIGKSQVARWLATSCAGRAQPVLLFSLEMDREQLYPRFIAAHAAINIQALRTGEMTDREWGAAFDAAAQVLALPIALDSTPRRTSQDVYAETLRWAAEHGKPRLVVVDYLQILGDKRGPGQDRREVLGDAAKTLRQLARELKIPVAILSQLNRASELRESRVPELSDLSESGIVEQDADMVWLLWRPEVHRPQDVQYAHKLAIIVAKQRNGPVGRIWLHFRRQTGQITELPKGDWPREQERQTASTGARQTRLEEG